jgi:hypothetical protein
MKQDWGLNDVWNYAPRFERLNSLTNSKLWPVGKQKKFSDNCS